MVAQLVGLNCNTNMEGIENTEGHKTTNNFRGYVQI